MTKTEWLKQKPPIEYVVKGESDRDYIPIGLIEQMLDELCEDDDPWEVKDFWFEVSRHGDFYFANSSCSLVVHYDGITRVLSGSKSFLVSGKDENKDYAGAALSHCISSAAGRLGNRFGRALNGRLDPSRKSSSTNVEDFSRRPKIDMITLKKYEKALKNNEQKFIEDIESTYNLNTPEAMEIVNKYKK